MRDNGAIQDGASGFAVGDEVVVAAKYDKSKIYVVAHKDGIMACGYVIELISAIGSYFGRYQLASGAMVKSMDLESYSHTYGVFDGYFLLRPYPNADITEESCVCVVPSEPTNLIVNVAADNLFTTASGHRDDWHRINFRWIGYPYWFAPYSWQITTDWPSFSSRTVLEHPGISLVKVYYHLSHSPYTDGNQSREHIIRHIDQEKRVYRPGSISLKYDDVDGKPVLDELGQQKYYMTSTYPYRYGKKPFTRDSDGKVTSYNERVTIGAGGEYTIPAGYDMVFFFWPFIPYLWEIPYFNFFAWADNEALYQRCITPESGAAFLRGWHFEADTAAGGSEDIELYADSAVFTVKSGVNESVAKPASPVTGTADYDGTESHLIEWGYTAELTKTVPIGTVCNKSALAVKHSLSLDCDCMDNTVTRHAKESTLPLSAYYWYPSWPAWWPVGGYSDHSTIARAKTGSVDISAALQSELKFGSTVIDSGSGTMTYEYEKDYATNSDNTLTISVTEDPRGPLPYYTHLTSQTASGTRKDDYKTTGTMKRNIVSFAVLDYDSESNFQYEGKRVSAVAVVYKKITIAHEIKRERNKLSEFDTGGGPITSFVWTGGSFNNWDREPNEDIPGEIAVTDNLTISGTRTVEYKVYANVNGHIYAKTLGTVITTVDSDLNATVSGNRIYGTVCKLQTGKLLVTYDLDEFVTTANAHAGYDSPFNFEDWNSNLGTDIWKTVKRVVGVVHLGTLNNFGAGIYDEQEPIPSEIYAISMKR